MKSKKISAIIAIILAMSMFAGCINVNVQAPADNALKPDKTEKIKGKEFSTDDSAVESDLFASKLERPALILKELNAGEVSITSNIEDYEIAPDLSNVYRADDFWFNDDEREMLAKNQFCVTGYAGGEFFEIYEFNRYDYIPSFITVDSLMHTYHLYFAYLLKKIEKNELSDDIEKLSKLMAEDSLTQYEALKGSEWEGAALRNVAFFTIGAKLFDDSFEVCDDAKEVVDTELERIYAAEGINTSLILPGVEEDYSQYKPRGYYDGDEQLEKYFRAMMWYGRLHFKQDEEDFDRSSLLITKAIVENDEAYELWSAVYAVTSFFAGASDDAGVAEYAKALNDAYGTDISVSNLVGNTDSFDEFHKLTKDIKVPQINSIPIYQWDETNIIPGFRFMGQRFTIDASIMQKLIYRAVNENSNGERRMLPNALDFPAALGSDTALEILEENGETDYEGYMENMEKMREAFSDDDSDIWSASLYSSWLHTLRPLLNEDRASFPQFMRSKEWLKKNLECFAGSFTELKHDTVLYSKQILAEMGGGEPDVYDDRGYVEPEPLVYSRFINLATQMLDGLKGLDMLSSDQEDDLNKLIEIASRLKTISEKELEGVMLTDEEFDFIREYGGNIEHFWYEIAKEDKQDEYVSTQEYPAALVTDIATDPDGNRVLEIATDNPSIIYVLVKVDDKIKFARGSVYSFYQFEMPINNRLTDKDWWKMLGIDWELDAGYDYDEIQKNMPKKPEWTKSYSCLDE